MRPTCRSIAVAATIMLVAGAGPSRFQADLVPSARALIDHAKSGLVAAKDPKKPEIQLTIADFAPMTEWAGPKTSAKAPEHK